VSGRDNARDSPFRKFQIQNDQGADRCMSAFTALKTGNAAILATATPVKGQFHHTVEGRTGRGRGSSGARGPGGRERGRGRSQRQNGQQQRNYNNQDNKYNAITVGRLAT
jgi:hypothetical protein